MEKLVIVVGDTTSHGGEVLTGDLTFEISDRPAASVGDHVHCPIHGDTTIIEGYQTVTIQPSRHLAYEGCKTSCGATLIGGKQTICYIGFDDEPEPVAPHAHFEEVKKVEKEKHPPHPAKHEPKQAPHPIHHQNDEIQKRLESNSTHPNEDEFKLMVATVWGEGCSQSDLGWKAITSVIMNRVGFHRWKGYNKSVTSVIYNTGFDAVHSHLNLQFPKAIKYFFHNEDALTLYEKKRIHRLMEVIRPVYYQKQTTTHANYYYSPEAQRIAYETEKKKNPQQLKDGGRHPLIPSFLRDKTIHHVYVNIAHTDDLKFYFGP